MLTRWILILNLPEMKPFFRRTAKFSASESFCDACYRIFQVVIAVFCQKEILCIGRCHSQKCWYHIQKTAPSPPMAMANASSVILPIPIAVPRDIYKVGRYFRLFAFFLGPLIICRTKGICQIRERRRPSLMEQPLAERLCLQNLEEFLGYRYSSEHGSWSCFWWRKSQPGRSPYLFWAQTCWYSR